MEEDQLFEEKLDELVEETAKESAIVAINIKNLLTKKWNEEKGAYMI